VSDSESVKLTSAPSLAFFPALAYPWASVILSFAILLLDLVTGKFLIFPIMFVIPVALSAWSFHACLAYTLAVALPICRLAIAAFVEKPSAVEFMLGNAAIRIAVLLFIAFLVTRVARLSAALQKQVEGLVTVCAWSKTIEHEGEWLSFEEYLRRRFNLKLTHGISPAEAEKAIADLHERNL
jgi:hypothetical protein